MSLKSTTSYTTGHSTSNGVNITDYRNAAAALAMIGNECKPSTKLIADVYCIEGRSSYLLLRHELHKAMIKLLKADGKKLDHALPIVDVGLGQVYHGKYKTLDSSAAVLGITKKPYVEAWQVYVNKLTDLLKGHLFDADMAAGDYFYREKQPIDNHTEFML